MLAPDALDHRPEPGADVLPKRPVDGDVAPHGVDQFTGYGAEGFVAQHLHRAVVGFQSVVEGQLIIAQAQLLAAGVGLPHVLCKLDKLLDDLRRLYRPVLVAS